MSEEKPPIGKSWNNLYLLLIATLLALILGFYFFEKHFQ
jgi:hypothetical protein